jgi:recombination protein RecA
MGKTIIEEMLDKFGEEILTKEYTNGFPSISTGSLSVDVSTGIGGLPYGRFTEIYGPEMSGKTTLCLSTCKEMLKAGGKVLYLDLENSVDMSRVKELTGGYYDESRMLVVQPISGEEAMEISQAGVDIGFNLVIFDSVGAISPEAELDENDYTKSPPMALTPRLISRFLRKTSNMVQRKETAFVFTNQVRANIGAYMGGYVTPAGYALKHYTSMRLFISKRGAIEDKDKNQIGQYSSFTVKKNKLSTPFRQAEFPIFYDDGVSLEYDALSFGALLGVVKTRGSYFVFEDTTLGQGKAKAGQFLKENPETLDKIREMCYNASNVRYPPIRFDFEEGNDGTED